MNSRDAQDVILRLLADGPYRAMAIQARHELEPQAAAVVERLDLQGLDRFGRFLCRHYYRERVVHYFKYSRALAARTGRAPEAALKTPEFTGLIPRLILGDRRSAERVLELLRRRLTADADAVRAAIPYWDELVAYQSVFFLSDALPPAQSATPFPARAATATVLDLSWDLTAVLPALLRLSSEVPQTPRRPTRLLFARSQHGEVTVLRCTEALKSLLEGLTGQEDPAQLAARMGLDAASVTKTLKKLEEVGAVVAQETFSASHLGSDLTPLTSS